MSNFREWMYNRWGRGGLTSEFLSGVEHFCDWSFLQQNKSEILCPCSKCDFQWPPRDRGFITIHLYANGFRPNYYIWNRHGEDYGQHGVTYDIMGAGPSCASETEQDYRFQDGTDFVHGWFPQYNHSEGQQLADEPNLDAKEFYDLIAAADKPLYEGHNMSQLHWIAKVMKFKTQPNTTQAHVREYINGCIRTALPEHQHAIPDSYYKVKRMMMKLGLGVIKYDVCKNNCCLYYKENANLISCPICGEPRYKTQGYGAKTQVPFKKLWYFPITHRLQRLFMSRKIAEHMTWHTKCQGWSDKMVHPAQSEAWKSFDHAYPDFANETRNVRVGLCTDGFCPNDTLGPGYSCWPVFITPYNLPPSLCMREEFIFMSMMISGPTSPGKKIDILLRPLIDELKSLWANGAATWDCHKQENFTMRVAVLWTISDFPAYGMLSGWSTHGRLSCPYCQGDTDAFRLQHGMKPCWFDCHRAFLSRNHPLRYNIVDFKSGNIVEKVMPERKTPAQNKRKLEELGGIDLHDESAQFPGYGMEHNWFKITIFTELPYYFTLLVPHNLDLMHCTKNFFCNILNTTMDQGKDSRDNKRARLDLEKHTGRQSLFMSSPNAKKKTKATYTLTTEQKRAVCKWIKELRFPDGHVSNLQENAKIEDHKIIGLKTHDCHVFMQRLVPIAFKQFLPEAIWEVLVEVSNAFRAICGSVVSVSEMDALGKKVVEVMCKLEMIYPPAFFDVMEHLLIHLPYEARVCGPVFYRWMYPFERKLGILKRMARQKNRLEGSICEAYLMREIVHFCEYFFGDDEHGNALTRLRRHETIFLPQFAGQLSIFTPKGKPLKRLMSAKLLSESEYEQALLCIVMNCPELFNLTSQFDSQIPEHYNTEDRELARMNTLLPWLRHLTANGQLQNESVEFIFNGGSYAVVECQGYTVNGYKFETEKYGEAKKVTMNYGVCVKMDNEDGTTNNYYGVIKEIIRMSFNCPGREQQHIYLFKCAWFDSGHVVTDQFGLVNLRPDKVLKTNEPFILADVATQVYYAMYPYYSLARRHVRKVWAVCPIRARHFIDLSSVEGNRQQQNDDQDYYQDEAPPTSDQYVGFNGFNLDIPLADTATGEVPTE